MDEEGTKHIEQLLTQVTQHFDYKNFSPLTQTLVQQHTKEIKNLMRRTAQDILNIGQRLIEVKEHLGHGHFEAWLKAEFNWGQWTARKFMQVARQFKSVNFTDLSIDVSALYILSAPSTLEAVRQEALQVARQGEVITHTRIKAIASQYKAATKPQVCDSAKLSSMDIPVETVQCEVSTCANTSLMAKIGDTHRVTVKESEDKLSTKRTIPLVQLQVKNCSDEITAVTDSDSCLPQEQMKIHLQSVFMIDNVICLTDLRQQDQKWLGKIAEIKKATPTDIEVVIKISASKFAYTGTTNQAVHQSIFPDDPQLNALFQYIESNYYKSISLQDVAGVVGYSPSYLTHLVRGKTGKTVYSWIIERRMAQARSLLLETDQSVEQISLAVGYQDASNFFQQFRQHHKITPQVWRKLHRNPSEISKNNGQFLQNIS